MTTGNNKENPYGDYVPGQYSNSGTGENAQGTPTNPYSTQNTGYGEQSQSYNTQGYDYNQSAPADYSNGYQAPTYGGTGYDNSPYGYQPPKPKGLAIAALVLGILALLSGWMLIGGLFGLVGLILGIVALVKANKGQADGKGMAITGIVLSSLGLLTALVMGAFFGWAMFTVMDCLEYVENEAAYQQCVNEQFGVDTTYSNYGLEDS